MRIVRRLVADADHDRGEGRAHGLADSGLSGHPAPLLRKGRKRESIHASLEFIWEISADIS
jgi:hypothetical protein